ncbi:MAG: hypothetical protein LUD07_02615 [Clostridiales bacterium]|nr:hypothetical protein [Clostridiales bacterium]
MKKYIFIVQDSHLKLGLFEDLKQVENVEICKISEREINNPALRLLKRIHCSWTINKHLKLPFRRLWYNKVKINIEEDCENFIVVVDIGLKALSTKMLKNIFSMSNVNSTLMFINSYDAASIGMLEIKDKVHKIHWDKIMTFDPHDAKKYGWMYMGTCYYSMHSKNEIQSKYPSTTASEAYFIGGIKGNRERLILEVFEWLKSNGVNVCFNLMVSGKKRFETKKFEGVINYYGGRDWIPYEQVLASVLNTNVIIEVLQENQEGPSLRYYEAVCYNKKLLSNNRNLSDLPFYDPRYMKYFDKYEDIDIEWVKSREKINYSYDGSFSPSNLIKLL